MANVVQLRSSGEIAQKTEISQMSIYLRFCEDAGIYIYIYLHLPRCGNFQWQVKFVQNCLFTHLLLWGTFFLRGWSFLNGNLRGCRVWTASKWLAMWKFSLSVEILMFRQLQVYICDMWNRILESEKWWPTILSTILYSTFLPGES